MRTLCLLRDSLGRWLAGEAGEGAAGKRGFVGVAGSNMNDDLLQ